MFEFGVLCSLQGYLWGFKSAQLLLGVLNMKTVGIVVIVTILSVRGRLILSTCTALSAGRLVQQTADWRIGCAPEFFRPPTPLGPYWVGLQGQLAKLYTSDPISGKDCVYYLNTCLRYIHNRFLCVEAMVGAFSKPQDLIDTFNYLS